jgi:hypothetical protein
MKSFSMTRISLGHFIIAGLVFWGLPGVFVAGPSAIVYTVACVLPVWWFCRHDTEPVVAPARRLSTATCAVLTVFSLAYLAGDATIGRQLLQQNMFLFHSAGMAHEVDAINSNVSMGGGLADLLGYIFVLLPLGLIDATRNTSHQGRWILWAVALLLLFYDTGAGRGFVLMVVAAIVLGRTSDWRRMVIGIALALGVFSLASIFRGDTANTQSPLLSGIVTPYINLGLMLNAHCGTAPWYSFLLEFMKKFMPAFLIPKKVFSFNMEMSLCLYPSADNTVESVSVFTWLGEIYYYTPPLLTSLLAGGLLGALAHAVDRKLVRNQMYSARLLGGLLCFYLPRSRTQDIFTFLIAQFIFLAIFWPQLCNLTRSLHRFVLPTRLINIHREPKQKSL